MTSADVISTACRRASTSSTARKGSINLVVSRDYATFAVINNIRDYETTILLAGTLFMALHIPIAHGLC